MKNQKMTSIRIPTKSAKALQNALGKREDTYNKLLKNVQPSTVTPLDDDRLNSSFQNRREVERDRAVTDLLRHYVNAYCDRQQDNRQYRRKMFSLCKNAVTCLIGTIIISILYALIFTERDVTDIVALVTACVSSIGSIAFLLDIIAKYVFPSNEEEHTAQMVQSVQNNDLEERKLRYEYQKILKAAAKENMPDDSKSNT